MRGDDATLLTVGETGTDKHSMVFGKSFAQGAPTSTGVSAENPRAPPRMLAEDYCMRISRRLPLLHDPGSGEDGLVVHLCSELLQKVYGTTEPEQIEPGADVITVSAIEIFRNGVRDMLGSAQPLKIVENEIGCCAEGAVPIVVESTEQVTKIYFYRPFGACRRRTPRG